MGEMTEIKYFIECLEQFLDSFDDEKVDITKIISNAGLRLLTIDYQKKIDKKYCTTSAALKIKQSQRYFAMQVAIQEILKGCEEKQLKPVFMKGILLALDIYEDIGMRKCGDIDVLIEIEHFSEFNKILENLGYEHDFPASFERCSREFRNHHIKYQKKINNIELLAEVHSSIVNPVGLFRCEPRWFILNTRQVEQLGIKACVLGIEYNLIALMLHFFKHLPMDYFQNMMSKKDVFVDISNLHDIALFLYKYHDMVNWDLIIEICIQMMIVKYIVAVARYVNEIYGELFSNEFISKLSKNEKYTWIESRTIGGMGDLFWLMVFKMDLILNNSLKKIVLGQMPEGIDLIALAVGDGKRKLVINKGEKLRLSEKYEFSFHEQKPKVFVDLDVFLDHSFIEVSYSVENKVCCCFREKGCFPINKYRRSDSLEIIIIKENYILHRMFTIAEDETGYYVICSSNNWNYPVRLDNTGVKYELMVEENRFTCSYSIPWNFVNVDMQRDKIIPFNICASISNPVTTLVEQTCNLFKRDENFWDFRGVFGVEVN